MATTSQLHAVKVALVGVDERGHIHQYGEFYRRGDVSLEHMTAIVHPKDQEVLESIHIAHLPKDEQLAALDRILEALAVMGAQGRVRQRLTDKGVIQ